MEISITNFLLLRDGGGIQSRHCLPSPTKGMMTITSDGLSDVLQGAGVLRMLHHYCCRRFEVPKDLLPVDEQTVEARKHNWSTIADILRHHLSLQVMESQVSAIAADGDIAEALIIMRSALDALRGHRQREKEVKRAHRQLDENPTLRSVKELLTTKSADTTKTRKSSPTPKGVLGHEIRR